MQTVTKTKESSIADLPALMDTKEFAALLGYGVTYTSRLCKNGTIPATKVGREWRIPTRKALEKLGVI